MRYLRLIAGLVTGLGVSACAPVETVSRNAPLTPAPSASAAPQVAAVEIRDIRVSVPPSLNVSEANRYYPGGDIVWREDPPGDRYAQVRAIFETAMRRGVDGLEGGVPAVLEVEVTRFHALSEKARYTIGGVHALQFRMQLRDPESGMALGEPRFVKADFKAFGGAKAVEAERNGITQKHRITEQLARAVRAELTDPAGHSAANLGLIGALNQL